MEPLDISLPDAKLHIAKLAMAFPQLPHDATLELRMLKFDGVKRQSKSRRFDPTNLLSVDQTLQFAQTYNQTGWNIYITPNPINADGNLAAPSKGEDVICATQIYLDCDERGAAERLLQEIPVDYDYLVVTGKQPYLRLHWYVQLDEPLFDLMLWRDITQRMIETHSCDARANKIGGIMRLAGFVSYPPKHKQKKRYVTELVKLYDREDHHDFI
jgi:hypothetical protein